MRALCGGSRLVVRALIAGGGAASALGQPRLFVGEYAFNSPMILAVRTDGGGSTPLFSPPASQWLPLGMHYNPSTQRLTWMDSAGGSEIMRADLGGAGLITLASVPGFCRGIALDSTGRIYFGSDNRVMRVNANGSGLTTLYTGPTSFPVGQPHVDMTNNHVYVGADGEIIRMNLDGGDLKVVVRGISQPRAVALDLAAGFIYWIDADTISDYVGRARLDGSEFSVILDHSPNVQQSPGMSDFLIDPAGGAMYYADDLIDHVYRADLSGASRTLIYAGPAGRSPVTIALETGVPVQPMLDCDGNGIHDDVDLAGGAADCDGNGRLDRCQTDPCPSRVFLLDNGSDAEDTQGRAVGSPSLWQTFQPFDVPAQGWLMGEIGVDGCTFNYADGSGFTARLFPDDGTGLRPDEERELASAVLNFRFNTGKVNWVYAPMIAALAEGRYWVRLEANNTPIYSASLNHGFSGLVSASRGISGNFVFSARTSALRIVQGTACAADFNGDGFVDFFDFDDFVICFEGGPCPPGQSADFNDDGFADFFDYDNFVIAFEDGC